MFRLILESSSGRFKTLGYLQLFRVLLFTFAQRDGTPKNETKCQSHYLHPQIQKPKAKTFEV
jgi:hypothetical protein